MYLRDIGYPLKLMSIGIDLQALLHRLESYLQRIELFAPAAQRGYLHQRKQPNPDMAQ
jgi:hypothetical protein